MANGRWHNVKLEQILQSSPAQRMGGLMLSLTLRFWMRTLDYRAYYYDRSVDPVFPEFSDPVIFILWHEYTLIPFYLRRRYGLGVLASRHRDAEWLSQMAILNGFQVFRGSSGRGGVGAIKAIFDQPTVSGLVLTPDGPRGPRRVMAAGAIFIASKLDIPLVPVGMGYQHPWRLQRSWDKFPLPKPGSRARVVVGPRFHIPQKLTREEFEHYRWSVEQSLNCLTEAAEMWAEKNAWCPHACIAEPASAWNPRQRPRRSPALPEKDVADLQPSDGATDDGARTGESPQLTGDRSRRAESLGDAPSS
jgi:lysophospholipid acyltransferase (LPLAT)-like uncharacterized protein